jgi:predicted nucleotidyltransferase
VFTRKEEEIMIITERIKKAVDPEIIYLFGSHAYGEPRQDSDYDFYVVVSDNAARPLEIKRRINKELGKTKMSTPVDVLAKHASEFYDMSALPTLERKVAREGVVLYARN